MAMAIFQLFFCASAIDAAATCLALSVLTERPYAICGGGAKEGCAEASRGLKTSHTTATNNLLRHFCAMTALSFPKLSTDMRGLCIPSASPSPLAAWALNNTHQVQQCPQPWGPRHLS